MNIYDPHPIVKSLLNILQIESFTYQEDVLADYVEHSVQQYDQFSVMRVGNALVCQQKNVAHLPLLAFYGHLDTVSNQQDKPPYATETQVFGCGASDMKGGLAVMLELMKLVQKKPVPNYGLQFVFYDAEEGAYLKNGLEPLYQKLLASAIAQQKPELAIVLEPTNNTVQSGCLGNIHWDVCVTGKSGHTARPWQADNPIAKVGPLLKIIFDYAIHDREVEGLVFRETLVVSQIHAGLVKNVIPANLNMNVNYRFAPDRSQEQAKQLLHTLFADKRDVQVQEIDYAPASKVVRQNAILQHMMQKYALLLEPKQAWTDIARLCSWGLDAVNFGPGDPGQAHQKNEHIAIDSLIRCYDLLADFIYSPS